MDIITKTRVSGKSRQLRPTAPTYSKEQRPVVTETFSGSGLVPSPYYLDGRDVPDKYSVERGEVRFQFNGVDQYATIPDWTPLGLSLIHI